MLCQELEPSTPLLLCSLFNLWPLSRCARTRTFFFGPSSGLRKTNPRGGTQKGAMLKEMSIVCRKIQWKYNVYIYRYIENIMCVCTCIYVQYSRNFNPPSSVCECMSVCVYVCMRVCVCVFYPLLCVCMCVCA